MTAKELEGLFLELFAKQYNGDFAKSFCNKMQQLKSEGYSFYKIDEAEMFNDIIDLELTKSQFIENPPSLWEYLNQRKSEDIQRQDFITAEKIKTLTLEFENYFPELLENKVSIYGNVLKLSLAIKLNNKQADVYLKSNSNKFNSIVREATGMNIYTS